LPGQEGGYFERMRAESDALERAQKELRLAETRRERLVAQRDSESPIVASGAGTLEPAPNSIDARIRDYRATLDRLLLEYTDRHPDVINAREALVRLEQQRNEQLLALGVSHPDQEVSTLGSNPVYESVRIALNEIDVTIQALQADVTERTAKLSQLQALIDEVPEVEAELARLNRDYEVVYEQYQSMVRSREIQALSRKASDTDDVDFRVIDPPLAGFEPVAPNRMLLLAAVFALSLGAGGALCWLLAQLRPVFTSVASLREVCALPVLGTVSQAWEAEHRRRRRIALLGFSAVMACLCALFGVAILLETMGYGLQTLVR
jgi:polysaccharide chain length determinant protein (PEP-CTERM system associated)